MSSTFSTVQRNVGWRGSTMAWACVTGIGAVLGGMYWMTTDVKKKEDMASPYAQKGQGLGGTDKAMTSGDVSAVVTSSARPPTGGDQQRK